MYRKGLVFPLTLALAVGLCLTLLPGVASAGTGSHVVAPGDTLWNIALRYGVTVESLVAANHLTTSIIWPGQTLVVPGEVRAAEERHVSSNWDFTADEIDLLARLIRAEAEGEPYVGKVAVGAVVLNRLRSPLFPKKLADVIYEPDQFEPVANGTIWLPATAEARRAALDAINGWDPTGGALYFYNPAKASSWFLAARRLLTSIGAHVFLA